MIDSMSLSFVLRDLPSAGSRDLDRALPVMDEEEFRAFYERTARPLWAYLARITGDRQEADDALQEAYYRFYRAGARHESETHRRNSLFRIATNVVRDSARRSRHYKPVELEEEALAAVVPENPRATPEAQTAMRNDLAKAMQQLEPMHREMLWLAYAQGASHEEISEILGVRAMSIRTTLLRARRKLADFLKKGGRP